MEVGRWFEMVMGMNWHRVNGLAVSIIYENIILILVKMLKADRSSRLYQVGQGCS